MADFSFSSDSNLRRAQQQVDDDPDSYEHWQTLVDLAHNQEGGLHRNSSPEAISACRQTYDAFLARYPLFYGYWKRYADFEFSIAGSEAAELIYERGVACNPYSASLWTDFCTFKMETCHNWELTRELFQRGAEMIGLDFNAHTFWIKYVECTNREGVLEGFKLLQHVTTIPLAQYGQIWEQYRQTAARLPVEQVLDEATLQACQRQVYQELGQAVSTPLLYTQTLRKKVDAALIAGYPAAERAVTDRWAYESKINPAWYTVEKLSDQQLSNWKGYLAYEEKQWELARQTKTEGTNGSYERTKLLYERCLIAAANYEEIWFQYIHWLQSCDDKTEEVRCAFERASCIFIDIAEPAIRLAWAKFEESVGRPDVAIGIHEAILLRLPDDFETYYSMINVIRRQDGFKVAEDKVRALLKEASIGLETRGALLTQWARLKLQAENDYSAALALFPQHHALLTRAHTFWSGWLVFESERPQTSEDDTDSYRLVRQVHVLAQTASELSIEARKALAAQYIAYLDARGSAETIQEVVMLDAYIHGRELGRASKYFDALFGDTATNGVRAKPSLASEVASS